MLYKIGITGNICSGKSSCLKYFAKMQNSITINLDELGHTVYSRNLIFLQTIKKIFGGINKNIFLNENTFYEIFVRKELGKVVFNSKSNLETLNKLIRPEIQILLNLNLKKIENQSEKNKIMFVFIEGATIIESQSNFNLDEIWMTVANPDEVKRRFIKRLTDNHTKEYDSKILNNILQYQLPPEQKLKFCTEVIDTSDEFKKTQLKYDLLYEKLKKIYIYNSFNFILIIL